MVGSVKSRRGIWGLGFYEESEFVGFGKGSGTETVISDFRPYLELLERQM